MMHGDISRVYELFADILGYPTSGVRAETERVISLLAPISEDALGSMEKFLSIAEEMPLSRLEEVYTRTFDLQAVCVPYVGCHLFGEDPIRGMFMVKLKELYRSHDFRTGNELPDHVCLMLRFLSICRDAEDKQEMIDYCLIPSLRKMADGLGDSDNPYLWVLKAAMRTIENNGQEPGNDAIRGPEGNPDV